MKNFKARELRSGSLVLAATLSAIALGGCMHGSEPGSRVAGWTLIEPSQRHPIMVSQEPTVLPLRINRGSSGLSPRQRAEIVDFYAHFRAQSSGGGRVIVQAPSGSPNEVAAMQAVQEVRALLESEGAGEGDINVEAYHSDGDPQPPIRLSYMKYVAEAPDCGMWPTNLAQEPANLPYPNLGCATQRNFAAQVANASDLIQPRGMTSRSSERRDVIWNKYIKGETTGAKKTEEEKVKVKSAN
ncbi:MAG: CpaD family pilus assembly lipoprotein [Alphaproteobacteria bacterium]|nr:CpaD family pilus assembly lipoprotein [Alphaproteobacteria bacterium]